MNQRIKHAFFVLIEKMLAWCVIPQLRARILRVLGARIGVNVRIYEARFFNLMDGFRNLEVGDDVHIGPGSLIDLSDKVIIGSRAVISPRVVVLTHSDAGEFHESELSRVFPAHEAPVTVGRSAWVGANSTLLCGVEVGFLAVVGAGSVVVESVPPRTVVAGSPARKVRDLDVELDLADQPPQDKTEDRAHDL